MRNLLIGLAGFLSFAAASQAIAQDWVVGGDGSDVIVGYDQDDIRVSGNTRAVWAVMVLKDTSPAEDGLVAWDYALVREIHDCIEGKSRIVAMRHYRFGSQQPADSFDDDSGRWGFHEPGTIAEATARAICSVERQETLGISSAHDFATLGRTVLAGEAE